MGCGGALLGDLGVVGALANFTDPESRIMKDGASKSFEQSYNCQAAVDEKAQVVVASYVTQASNDKREIEPSVKKNEVQPGRENTQKVECGCGVFQ